MPTHVKSSLFQSVSQWGSGLNSGKSRSVCVLNGKERKKNDLMCWKDSKGVSVFTVNILVCSWTFLSCRQKEHAPPQTEIHCTCVVERAPEAAAGWSRFLTSSPLLLSHSFCQTQNQGEEARRRGGNYEDGERERADAVCSIVGVEPVRGRTPKAGYSLLFCFVFQFEEPTVLTRNTDKIPEV